MSLFVFSGNGTADGNVTAVGNAPAVGNAYAAMTARERLVHKRITVIKKLIVPVILGDAFISYLAFLCYWLMGFIIASLKTQTTLLYNYSCTIYKAFCTDESFFTHLFYTQVTVLHKILCIRHSYIICP